MRSPEALANWALECAGVGQPWYLVGQIIKAFDLDLEVRPGLHKAGMLDLVDGRVAIVVKSSGMDAKRFSAAHELGHYLLASEENFSLLEQLHDRSVERYCNAFASHLLIPREWLRFMVQSRSETFDTAMDIAFQSQASLTSVILALNRDAGWNRDDVKWELAHGTWNLTRAPRRKNFRSIRSAHGTAKVLEKIGDQPIHRSVPIETKGGAGQLEIELVRLGGVIFGLLVVPDVQPRNASIERDHS